MKRVAIVGAGIIGLRLSQNFAQSGWNVTLFEAGKSSGGLASSVTYFDKVWDRFYHVILFSDLSVRKLLAELDLDSESVWGNSQTGFYCNRKLLPFSSTLDFIRFPYLSILDKIRLCFTILRTSKIVNPESLDNFTVSEWLIKNSGIKVFNKIWMPLLKCKLGNRYVDTSATFIWAIIYRLYAARRSGFKQEQFGFVNGGYQRICSKYEDLLKQLNVNILTQTTVNQIDSSHTLCFVRYHDNPIESFDKVVITLPSPAISSILPQLSSSEQVLLQSHRYQGVVCASVLLTRKLSPFYVTNITDDEIDLTGVIEMTTLVPPSYFGNCHLVYLPKYLSPDDPMFRLSDIEIQAHLVLQLKKMHPDLLDEQILHVSISRAKYVFPIPLVRQSRIKFPFTTSIPGVHIVNSSQIVDGTLNVNESLNLADRAFAAICH